jgi:hypothetical protein
MHNRGMETPSLPTDEEIGKAYYQGKTSVITLLHETLGQLVLVFSFWKIVLQKIVEIAVNHPRAMA